MLLANTTLVVTCRRLLICARMALAHDLLFENLRKSSPLDNVKLDT